MGIPITVVICFLLLVFCFIIFFVGCMKFYEDFKIEITKVFKTEALVWSQNLKGEFLLIYLGGHHAFKAELSSLNKAHYNKFVIFFRTVLLLHALIFFYLFFSILKV